MNINQEDFKNSIDQAIQAMRRFAKTWESLQAEATMQDAETREQYDSAWGRFWKRMNS